MPAGSGLSAGVSHDARHASYQLHDLLRNDRPARGCGSVRGDSTPHVSMSERRLIGHPGHGHCKRHSRHLDASPAVRCCGNSVSPFRALQTAGGIILLVIANEMVFARPTSAFKLTPPEGAEAQTKDDVAVFPPRDATARGPRRHERRHPASLPIRMATHCFCRWSVAALASRDGADIRHASRCKPDHAVSRHHRAARC